MTEPERDAYSKCRLNAAKASGASRPSISHHRKNRKNRKGTRRNRKNRRGTRRN
jgi:hypothetical protein